MKLLTIKDIMQEHGVSKKRAILWAKAAGTAPRVKNGKIYVSDVALERFLGGKNA